jgi:Tol biopolymer transport system component
VRTGAFLVAVLALTGWSSAAPQPSGTLAFGTGQYVFAVRADGADGHALGLGDYPAYSRDGGRLAFTLNGVWTARADGSGRRHIVPRFAEYITYTDPTWSPDGSRLAYVRVDNGHQTAELWLVDRDGRSLHGLSIVHAADSPSWSPAGTWIAYAGDGGLAEVLADGRGKRLLLHGEIAAPVWSPDGRSIAFEKQRGTHVAISVLDLRTRRVRLVERNGGPAGPLAWSPDGAWIAYATRASGGGLLELRAVHVSDGREHAIAATFVQQLDGLSWRR